MFTPMFTNRCLGALMGAFVGDALGVPYEQAEREGLQQEPCTDMVGYGAHAQPAGTWSDDSSMMYGLLDALLKDGYHNPVTVMENFSAWAHQGAFTPHGQVFGIGRQTYRVLKRYQALKETEGAEFAARHSGFSEGRHNGNGALMRLMPLSLYTLSLSKAEAFQLSMASSALTHAHAISMHSCAFFTLFVHQLYHGNQDVAGALARTREDYVALANKLETPIPTEVRAALLNQNFNNLNPAELNTWAYVLNTLVIALWAVLRFDTYREAVLAVINLGGDADTNACVTGALCGWIYGLESVPENWRNALVQYDTLQTVMSDFADFVATRLALAPTE